ncbi:acyl-CoA thioesterase [Rapidithrix thailandica]|uniref:Acyl-CoA thioesterase n=1 Tax=Rapidithrix thailandica TaxID=413964 RepID=A0AAW9SDA6_9BACT
MSDFEKSMQLRWSDIDSNFHVRHSVYYDLGAMIRTDFLNSHGLTMKAMKEEHFGPVLFREECVFRRELLYGEEPTINIKIAKLRKDYSRYSLVHEIKKKDGTLCALLTVDGAWMDTHLRKLTIPPQIGKHMIDAMEKTENFVWEEVPEKA